MDDPYNLQRFIEAQEPVFQRVCAELRAGEKRSHWMWFIFPQLKGLGHSGMARKFSIASLDEARAYLDHTVLGARLLECTRLVNVVQGRSIEQIFGYPDDMKFQSCMTLFSYAGLDNQVFIDGLQKYFDGRLDESTLAGLGVVSR